MPEQIRGYDTLSNYAIQLAKLPENITKKLPRYPSIGATLLGRLAVDDTFKGQGWGGESQKKSRLVSAYIS
jgi:hypothetical protein